MSESLADLRIAFEKESNRSLSMPIAGAIIWLIIGVCGQIIGDSRAVIVMLFGTGFIFPLALLIGKLRGENLTGRANPLSRLMGLSVLMVNLLWAVHLPLLVGSPAYFPLSLGIGLGIHWIVYGWIVQHPVGIVHAISRTAGVVTAWSAFPGHRTVAISAVIVLVYLFTLIVMMKRTVPSSAPARDGERASESLVAAR